MSYLNHIIEENENQEDQNNLISEENLKKIESENKTQLINNNAENYYFNGI